MSEVEVDERQTKVTSTVVDSSREAAGSTTTNTQQKAVYKQPTQINATNATTRNYSDRNATRAKQLTTFKGNTTTTSNNSNNNNSNCNKVKSKGQPPLLGNSRSLVDRSSLESINSKFSTSSANDDSQAQSTTVAAAGLAGPISDEQSSSGKTPVPAPATVRAHSSSRLNGLRDNHYVRPPVVLPTPTQRHQQSPLFAATEQSSPITINRLRSLEDSSTPAIANSSNQLLAMMNLGDQQKQQQEYDVKSQYADTSDTNAPDTDKASSNQCHQHHHQRLSPLVTSKIGGKGATNGRAAGGHDPAASVNGSSSSGKQAASSRVQPTRPGKSEPPFMFAGIASSIAGSVCFSLSILCIKLLPDDSNGFTEKAKALCFRGVFLGFICGAAITLQGSTFKVRRDELWVNILRACFGCLGALGSYCSLNYISMGDSTALVFSSPIWTSILSHFILGEPLQWIQLLALPASLFGIVLIAHPALIVNMDHLSLTHHHLLNITTLENLSNSSHLINHQQQQQLLFAAPTSSPLLATDVTTQMAAPLPLPAHESFEVHFEHRWPGIVIALATSLSVSCTYIVLKFRKSTPIQTTTFWLGIAMFCVSFAIMGATGFGDIPSTTYEWCLLLANGLTSWMGQSFLQWAFLHEEAGVLSIVRTLDVAMTFILSALFLDDDIYWTSIVGATIIGLVVVSIMLNNWIRSLTCMNRNEEGSAAAAAVAAAPPVCPLTNCSHDAKVSSANSERSNIYTVA